MARPRRTDAPDLGQAHDLTLGTIDRLICPLGKKQAFLRDTHAPSLRVRVTDSGAKSFVFEAKLNRQNIRRTIGDVRAWSIESARKEANRLRVELDRGEDPRETEKARADSLTAKRAAATARAVTVGELWPIYLTEGKPKRRDEWKPRYLRDLKRMSDPGGKKKLKGVGTTRSGPIYPLFALQLVDINEDTLKAWHDKEAKISKHQAARALMMFRGFLRWCATKPELRGLVNTSAGKAPALLASLPSMKRRTDALESAQVAGWWSGVEKLSNQTASVYLRALLLTGARREEMAALKWDDVCFRWHKLKIADKVDATRTIPLTPYMAQLLAALPRINLKDDSLSPFVFTSTGKTGHIADTRASHAKALQSAGIEGLTIHGLRRSFSLLGEAAGAPAGAIAQVMGHKPSATAEGYRPRSVDALRPFLALIETHVLGLAGVRLSTKTDSHQSS